MQRFLQRAQPQPQPPSQLEAAGPSLAWSCTSCTYFHEGVCASLRSCTMCDTPRRAEPSPVPPPLVPPLTPDSAPAPVSSHGCAAGAGYQQPKEASGEQWETQPAKRAKPTLTQPQPQPQPQSHSTPLNRTNSSASPSQPNAFSTLMSGARRAAKVVPWMLRAEAGVGWRAVLGSGGPPDATGPIWWSCEMELRGGGGGAAQKLRLLAPPPEPALPMPPAVAPVRLAPAVLKPLLSLLKSGLQKNVRRCRVDEAVRCASALLSLADGDGRRVGEAELLRRLPIIALEDALPEPATLPATTWLMAAHAKGFVLRAPHHELLLQLVARLAAAPWREAFSGRAAAAPPPPALLDVATAAPEVAPSGLTPSEEPPPSEGRQEAEAAEAEAAEAAVAAASMADLVPALLVRAAFGGMEGDVRMMREAAAVWHHRLRGEARGGGDGGGGNGGGAQPSGDWWAERLRRAFAAAPSLPPLVGAPSPPRAAPSLAASLAAAIPPSAVDFHISNVLESVAQRPEVRAALAALPGAAPGRSAVPDAEELQRAMWRHASSTSFKREWGAGRMRGGSRGGQDEAGKGSGEGGEGGGEGGEGGGEGGEGGPETARLRAVWRILQVPCERFAAEYISRLCGPASPLRAAMAAAAAAAAEVAAVDAASPAGAPSAAAAAAAAAVVVEAAPHGVRAVAHAALGGLHIVEDFVSEAEEVALLAWCDAEQPGWRLRNFNGPALGQKWGAKTDLRLRSVQRGEPLPAALLALCARMRALPSSPLAHWEANEANALSYTRAEGHHIAAHCDDRQLSGEAIVNLSLSAESTMTYDHDRDRARPPVRVLLPRRSLQIQTGDVRFNWRHAIHNADLPPTGRRVSITFRRAKLSP